MRIKEIESRLAAIKQEIESRGIEMTAAEINALEKETKDLTKERAEIIAAAEKRSCDRYRTGWDGNRHAADRPQRSDRPHRNTGTGAKCFFNT